MAERYTTGAKGRAGEDAAVKKLEEAGCTILARNYKPLYAGRFLAEIDIIAEDHDTIVFVEVKAFSSFGADTLEYAVGKAKRTQIIRGAQLFLASHREYEARPVRFDVCFCGPDGFRHIKNAFEE